MQRMTPGQGDKKWNNDPIIKPITTGSYYDGKKVNNPNDPPSACGQSTMILRFPTKLERDK